MAFQLCVPRGLGVDFLLNDFFQVGCADGADDPLDVVRVVAEDRHPNDFRAVFRIDNQLLIEKFEGVFLGLNRRQIGQSIFRIAQRGDVHKFRFEQRRGRFHIRGEFRLPFGRFVAA